VSAFSTLAAFAALGVLSLPHCLLMCGPIAARACASSPGAGSRGALAYLAGRTTSYVFIGASAGTMGAALLGEAGRHASLVLIELAAVVLFFQGLRRLFPRTTILSPSAGPGRLLARIYSVLPTGGLPLGLATGFLPCGALAAALTLAVAAGHPLLGAAGMAVFSLAGAPVLVLSLLAALRRRGAGGGRFVLLSRWAGAVMILLALAIAVRPFTDRVPVAAHDHCEAAPAPVALR